MLSKVFAAAVALCTVTEAVRIEQLIVPGSSAQPFVSAFFSPVQDARDREILGSEGLKLKLGESVMLSLPQTPSTGYTWQIDDRKARGIVSVA